MIETNTAPNISVIIPVYNTEIYLERCINSVLSQTYSNFELILVNDGSKDRSGIICDEYAKKDKRIIVLHKKNEGVSAARNSGIDIVKGKYIIFIDSDDYVESDFFEYAYSMVVLNKVDIFISGLIIETYLDGKITNEKKHCITADKMYTTKTLLEDLLIHYPQICICGPWCKLYSVKLIKSNNLYFSHELNYGEDTYFNLDFLAKTKKIYFSSASFYHYVRDRNESLFSRFHRDTYEVHTLIYNKMRKLMIQQSCNTEAIARFERLYFSMLISGLHEYYRFYKQTTKTERKIMMIKISNNKYIKKYKIISMNNVKTKILLLLLKYRWFWVLDLVFIIHYMSKKRSFGKRTK